MSENKKQESTTPRKCGRKKLSEEGIRLMQKRNSLPVMSVDEYGAEMLHKHLVKEMKTMNIRFSYDNGRGRIITTTGTLNKNSIPDYKKIPGRSEPKKDGFTVYYDVRHGIYRQFPDDKLIAINLK